ncbi:MAG: dihydroorotate dehydrogenase [Acidimicrobiales bacterium]
MRHALSEGDASPGQRPPLPARVGSLAFRSAVMTASGTAGHGVELAGYLDLAALGAVVVKSLSPGPVAGNSGPRLAVSGPCMINSVGLQGPGLPAWLAGELPRLLATGATVVASIWGSSVEDYAEAASLLATAPAGVVAVEVNLSCPNLEEAGRMFAQSEAATARAVAASAACGRPVWAKLSPAVADIVCIAGAALGSGAEALTLVNTLPGMTIDLGRQARLPTTGGGVSGPCLHPVALRSVYDCRAAFPDAGIVGVGGVAGGAGAVRMLMAGADAVQVGTASFADPRAPARVQAELARWCQASGVSDLAEVTSAAHRHGGG